MGNDYAGSINIGLQQGTELTDGSATYVKEIPNGEEIGTLLIDVTSDKGCTVDIVRYLNAGGSIEGVPSTQGVVSDGGPSGTFKYSDFGCAAAQVTVTKTEAGTTSGFAVSFRKKSE